MIAWVAALPASAAGDRWHLVAPWVGALGAFIAGSATFSNLLFAGLQQTIAGLHAHDPVGILALQGMGAAAGNIACIHNVVAASSVVGLVRAEGDVIRRAAPAMLAYLLFTSALGWLRAIIASRYAGRHPSTRAKLRLRRPVLIYSLCREQLNAGARRLSLRPKRRHWLNCHRSRFAKT